MSALDRKLRRRALRDRRSWLARTLPFVLPALVALVMCSGVGTWVLRTYPLANVRPPPRVLVLEPMPLTTAPEQPEPPPEPEPEPDEVNGQIVEIPKPQVEQRPEQSDYLAEFDNRVDRETRTEQFAVNPEVVSDEYSREQQVGGDELEDVQADRPATGAQVGNERFDPDRHGNFASMPSPWERTNKPGLDAPVPASPGSQAWAGAPQNDLLNEQIGDRTALNTREYLYASYLNRIRRVVNFYWKQNVDNLPSSVRFAKSSYATGVNVILTSEGVLDRIEVTTESGSVPLDDCVVRAFRTAGPFPNPPEGLVQPDGRVYLPDFLFDVQLGHAQMRYEGVDPRAGVQFPGLLKSPR